MASLSRPPHRRKHSATTNASSSSSSAAASRSPYDDVLLSSGGKTKFQAHDYAEIFSGSSSIPVLDLSGLDDRPGSGDCRSSNLDYSNIFGGLRDGDVAVPYEELFTGGGVRKTETRPADPQSPFQESSSVHYSGKAKRPSVEASDQSVAEIKQHINLSFNKISQVNSDASSNGKTHIAQLHAVPGFTHFVDGDRTVPSLRREVSRTWSFSAGVKSESTSKESYTPDNKTSNMNEINRQSHVSKVPPHQHPVLHSNPIEEKDPRRSRLPSFASEEASRRTAGGHLLDEELDENSIAAVSAAALKKAIEQAQESIRIAKIIMERKKEGLLDGSKPRSKGRSKFKDNKKETRISENVETASSECGSVILEFEKVDKCNLVSELKKEKSESTVSRSKEAEVVAELAEIVDEVSEQCEATVDPIKGPENIVEFPERDLNGSQSIQENERFRHESTDERENIVDYNKGTQEEEFVEHEEMDNEPQSLSGRDAILEQEEKEKRSENITSSKKNGGGEENGVMQKEEHLCVESDQETKEFAEEEIHEREPEIPEEVNVVREPEIHDEKMNCGSTEVLNSEIHRDAEETVIEASRSEEDEDGFDAVDAHSNDSSPTFSDISHSNETSTVICENQETCGVELDSKAQEQQAEVEGNKESDDSLDEVVTEVFSVIEENESLRRCASYEENLTGSKLNDDAFEGLSSDYKTENVGVMDAVDQETLPKEENIFTTANEIHSSNSEAEEFDNTNVETVLERTSESKEGYSSTSSLEDIDEVSPHESQAFAENVNEEVKDDIDNITPDEREHVVEQSEADRAEEAGENMESNSKENLGETSTSAQKDSKANEQMFDTNDQQQRIEAIKRGREREKDRMAVERAIREARERAFTEARERAAAERAATEAKLRAERAAVERATAEARERALEKAMSQRTSTDAKTQGDNKHPSDRSSTSSRNSGLKHSFSSSDLEKLDGTSSESAQRRKARLERHQRIMERSAKALAEKNMRDLLVQKEQAERNRLAESLDADIKRWATGKEGNLRALLSTLQYILGSESGWQPIPLTEIITTAAVKKAYRKATLCVHPDKLQQRRASIQQKYICEKVFDLLKAAWNRFNSEER